MVTNTLPDANAASHHVPIEASRSQSSRLGARRIREAFFGGASDAWTIFAGMAVVGPRERDCEALAQGFVLSPHHPDAGPVRPGDQWNRSMARLRHPSRLVSCGI